MPPPAYDPPAGVNPRLVLGSASPRRAALLRQLCLPFEQVVSPEQEPVPTGHAPHEFVVESAHAKARAVCRMLDSGQAGRYLVIGADTVVVRDEEILGKPADAAAAAAMLRALSGRDHRVYTGLALLDDSGGRWLEHVVTRVRMRPLTEEHIAWYVASGEPLDKAGAYGIQGLGARFVELVEGCYYNVVGFPLERLSSLLEAAGYRFPSPNAHTADAP